MKIYPFTHTCTKCSREYGSDYKELTKIKICPKCNSFKHRRAWRLKEMK